MRKHLNPLPALLAILGLVPVVAMGQATPAVKIGVVNFARLLQESPQARVTLKSLEDEFAPRERELLAKQNELKDRQAKLQKDLPVMGVEERRNAESKFRDDERDLGRRRNEFVEDFNVRRGEEVNKLQRQLVEQVQKFGKERGYDLIIGEGIIYATQSVDLTAEILQSIGAGAPATP
jgi:outer membrane protein